MRWRLQQIILISAWAGKVDVRRVTVVQLATASIVAFIAMGPAGETVPPMSTGLLVVALGLGIFSAIIQVTMNWAQRSVSPTRATVIYTGEPVWAGIFGRLAGERLPLLALLGAAFIIVGVLVSELKFKKKKRSRKRRLRNRFNLTIHRVIWYADALTRRRGRMVQRAEKKQVSVRRPSVQNARPY